LIGLLLVATEYIGFLADKLVRGYYFKDFQLRLPGVMNSITLALALYLLLVAATGRWLLVRTTSRHG